MTVKTMPSQLASAQPWLRDHYTALRLDVAPMWETTRAAVVPVVTTASQRVRNDVAPAAAQLSSQLAKQALERSAPLRSEMSSRYTAALAGARGQVTADQIAELTHSRSHRKMWLIGAAAAAGATLGAAAVFWQRSHYQDWIDGASQDSFSDNGHDPLAADAASPPLPSDEPQPPSSTTDTE